MDKLNRLGWAAGFSITAYGIRIGFRANRAEALERLPEYLPPGWKPSNAEVVDWLYSIKASGPTEPGRRSFNLVYSGISRIARTMDLDQALELLESDLHLYVAERARRRVFVHAGVVGYRGQAILVPGVSHSGKTSLVAALVRAGAAYYSDEYAVLDERGRVHPYAKPLSIRGEAAERPQRRRVEDLGGAAGQEPLPVGLVAVASYRSGGQWRPKRLSHGQGVLALLANTVPARSRPRSVMAVLGQVASSATILKGGRGEAEDAAAALLRALQ